MVITNVQYNLKPTLNPLSRFVYSVQGPVFVTFQTLLHNEYVVPIDIHNLKRVNAELHQEIKDIIVSHERSRNPEMEVIVP